MLDKILALESRVENMESLQATHMAQTAAIKEDTSAMIELFEALAGFWKVLEFIGKLAKPLAVVGTLFAAWFALKK